MKPTAHILAQTAIHDGRADALAVSNPSIAQAHRFCAQAIRDALLRRPDALPEEREAQLNNAVETILQLNEEIKSLRVQLKASRDLMDDLRPSADAEEREPANSAFDEDGRV